MTLFARDLGSVLVYVIVAEGVRQKVTKYAWYLDNVGHHLLSVGQLPLHLFVDDVEQHTLPSKIVDLLGPRNVYETNTAN